MLPVFLVQIGIFVVSVGIAVGCTLHYLLKEDHENLNMWLFYWMLYTLLQFLFYWIEPIMCYIFSLSPIDLYWEAKFAMFCYLTAPTFGGLLQAYIFFQTNIESYIATIWEKSQSVLGEIQKLFSAKLQAQSG
eukprot:Filipodium_phascolosomae@DN747_c0_g1_i1.p1